MIRKYIVSLVFVGLWTTIGALAQEKGSSEFDLSKNLSIYHNILKELNLLYVDSVDNKVLINKSINAMLEELDPYTIYIPEKDMDEFKTQTTGEYGGIGALVGKQGDYVILAEVYEGKSADKSGLKTGDKIAKINGEDAKGKAISDITDIMKGKPNTDFTVTIDRPYSGKKPFDVTVTREKIQLDCVPYDTVFNDNVGYILFTNFTDKAETRMKETVKKLKKQGVTSLVIDLRGNTGGLLDQAVRIVNLFIPKNETVVSTKGAVKQWDRSYQTPREPLDSTIPIAVLINSSSASASEILAGAIQDYDRGIVVGTHSFGKGLVQTTREVGYKGRLKLTTSKYYIPSGRCIQAMDYTHRNEDGSVGHIPDSLITAYKTHNGRTVYDGGGIMPDIKMETPKYSSLTTQLILGYKIFDFASWFVATHPSLSESFTVTDALYDKFKNYIDTTDFNYETPSYDALLKLKETLKEEKREGVATITELETSLKPNLKKDLELYKDEIKDYLEFEITKRYFYQKGGYKQSLSNDPILKKAVEVLQDAEKYKGMLDGSIPVDSSTRQKQEKDLVLSATMPESEE